MLTDGEPKVKAETVVTAFYEKTSKLDGMPFHKAHNGITRPEIGASLAFAERMASLAFQVRYLNEHRYIPELKRLLLSTIRKMFNLREETARKYAALAIQEVCLSDMCKSCEGRGYVASRFKQRKVQKLTDEKKRWWSLEVDYHKGLTDIQELSDKHKLEFVDVRWYVIKQEYKKLQEGKEATVGFYSYQNLLSELADKHGIELNTLLGEIQKWKKEEVQTKKSEPKPKMIAVDYNTECNKCNGSGYGRMLDKERADFLGVAAPTFKIKHKERYGKVYLRLRDSLQSIKCH
ncbi:hypothetical protein [Piscirickettsia litoralis]|uniref:Uncharacterized protein n=1 Tax=Piscirickettsia litoralis TaxID=1891921 RepID=A0ABX2ZZP1_9GAMM|nr:hypothetical protein [Piscirickettsia litoralis]ODN40926.1 hypothetical protein BGC07_19030 [Piscirickettsia litoralis]